MLTVFSTAPSAGTAKWAASISGRLVSITETTSPGPTPCARAVRAQVARHPCDEISELGIGPDIVPPGDGGLAPMSLKAPVQQVERSQGAEIRRARRKVRIVEH